MAIALSQLLQTLGLKTAFDQPMGSANFDRMAPRRADGYLALTETFHKTFLSLDEEGTEAAAATLNAAGALSYEPKIINVQVDHPFLFAIQQDLKVPIRYVGLGEQADDLVPFTAAEFVDALLGNESSYKS